MKAYLEMLAIALGVLLLACFIQGNFNVTEWEKHARGFIVFVFVIVVVLKEIAKKIDQ
jgi:membrane associated rhomboid family serine protease